MLIDFTTSNFLSFEDEVSLNMLAAKSVKEHSEKEKATDLVNVIKTENPSFDCLKVAAVYGANSSGKSNLIKAIAFVRNMVLNSFRNDSILLNFKDKQFLFSLCDSSKPSLFEITFLTKENYYRYGFEIKESSILSEWLFKKNITAQKESYCFKREKQKIQVNPRVFKGASSIKDKTRHNALFLSTCAQFNITIALEVKEWFRKDLKIIRNQKEGNFIPELLEFSKRPDLHNAVMAFMSYLDLGFKDIKVKESEASNAVPDKIVKLIDSIKSFNFPVESLTQLKQLEIFSEHSRYADGQEVDTITTPFRIESYGTQKLFFLLIPFFKAIAQGSVLIIDELDASLHTKLTIELIRIFQTYSSTSAQLIFTTHDTNLLRCELFRRDQVWFVEKNKFGSSDLYSLVEYKIDKKSSVRNDAAFNKSYLAGRYGAIPYFGDIQAFLKDFKIE